MGLFSDDDINAAEELMRRSGVLGPDFLRGFEKGWKSYKKMNGESLLQIEAKILDYWEAIPKVLSFQNELYFGDIFGRLVAILRFHPRFLLRNPTAFIDVINRILEILQRQKMPEYIEFLTKRILIWKKNHREIIQILGKT